MFDFDSRLKSVAGFELYPDPALQHAIDWKCSYFYHHKQK